MISPPVGDITKGIHVLVLVTGATGFIGSHLVPELLAREHRVRILARSSSDLSLLPSAIEVVRGGLEQSSRAMQGVEALVHLAATGGRVHSRSDKDGGGLRAVNVEGTRQVFEAAHGTDVRRAVLVTSMWTMLRPDLEAKSAYVASRLDSERAALAASASRPEVVILCPTFVVGPRDRGPNFPGSLIVAALRGRMRLVPSGGMNWIAVQDTARMIVAALEHGEHGQRYLVGAENRLHRELFTRVAQKAGRQGPAASVPKGLLRFVAAGADVVLAAAWQRSPIPLRFGVDLLAVDTSFDDACAPAWRALGEPRTPVDDAVDQAVAWFGANGYAG